MKSAVTTERYYARMRPDDAMDEVRGVLNRLVKVAPRNWMSIESKSTGRERRRADSNRRPPD